MTEREVMVQALRSCSNSQCGTCLYRGNGIACKKKLLAAAADELDTGFSRTDPWLPGEYFRRLGMTWRSVPRMLWTVVGSWTPMWPKAT